jgi:UTP--glucose-1-phosphate uridylyltransferase
MKAVIPAAGMGTRFLPATKAQPKEMLPVVDKPTIQYVVEEAVASGIEDILIVTGRGKRAIEDHFDRSIELEAHLEKSNKHSHLEELVELAELAQIHYIRQKEPKGLGHAVLCARNHVGKESFAVLLGDVITLSNPPCIKILWDIHEKYKASVIAVEEVPREKVSLYGIVDYEPVSDNLYRVKDIIEKPSIEEAPSQIATLGRYVLTPTIFEILEKTPPGLNNEIQLTDALRLLLEKEPLYAYCFSGMRFDIGNKLSWLIANIEIALKRDDLRSGLKEYLKSIFKE